MLFVLVFGGFVFLFLRLSDRLRGDGDPPFLPRSRVSRPLSDCRGEGQLRSGKCVEDGASRQSYFWEDDESLSLDDIR